MSDELTLDWQRTDGRKKYAQESPGGAFQREQEWCNKLRFLQMQNSLVCFAKTEYFFVKKLVYCKKQLHDWFCIYRVFWIMIFGFFNNLEIIFVSFCKKSIDVVNLKVMIL